MPLRADKHYLDPADAARFLSEPGPGRMLLDLGRLDPAGRGAGERDPAARMRREVLTGLAAHPQKWISPTYFYDACGSRLYERITQLAEYYPTRREAELLREVAPQVAAWVGPVEIVELGSGSATKTRTILEAFGVARRVLTYIPIDVSPTALEEATATLQAAYPLLKVMGLIGQYEEALEILPPAGDRLFLFLGGTIGNFPPREQAAFFERLAMAMRPGNSLLLGFDRRAHAAKPADVIRRAYNDAAGLTARFNLNLLARLNRELGADFRLERWRHRAIYNTRLDQIEMYLDSLAEQTVRIPSLGRAFSIAAGESILTELSRKFDPEELTAWFAARGFRGVAHWSDASEYVGLLLLQRTAARPRGEAP